MIYLHGVHLNRLVDKTAFLAEFDRHGFRVMCPRTERSWWTDKICEEFDPQITAERYVVDHVVPWMRDHWQVAPPAIALLGTSMGGQGALRLGFKHPETFPVVAGVASAIDYHDWYGRGTPLDDLYDSKEQARQDTATLHVHPAKWPTHVFFCVDPWDRDWWRGNDRLHEKLAALGVPHECDLATKSGGHSWAYFDAMAGRAVRFLAAGLEEQARRVL